MRRVRGYIVGALAGATLMLGGQALADIPDGDRIYACYYNGNPSAPNKPVQLLDKSTGTGNCPLGAWVEISWAAD